MGGTTRLKTKGLDQTDKHLQPDNTLALVQKLCDGLKKEKKKKEENLITWYFTKVSLLLLKLPPPPPQPSI